MYDSCMQTFNISLPEDLVTKVDEAAKKEYRNRSELIREALRVYLEKFEDWKSLSRYARGRAKAIGINTPGELDELIFNFRHGK